MGYKLAIANSIKVPVKFELNSNGKLVPFSFSLTCERLDTNGLKRYLDDEDALVREALLDIATDWDRQSLVLDADGNPAEFSREAFAMVLDIAGVATSIFESYLKEVAATRKN